MRSCTCRTEAGDTRITATPVKLADLPGGPAQSPLDQEPARQRATAASCTSASDRTATSARTAWTSKPDRAAIHEIDIETGQGRVFASGLRNPGRAGLAAADAASVDGRQRARRTGQRPRARLPDVGDATVGSMAGRTATTARMSIRACSRRSRTLVAKAIAPDYALGAHVASLGLAFYDRQAVACALRQRRLHRPARFVEPQTAERLQGGRSYRSRTAGPPARWRTCSPAS